MRVSEYCSKTLNIGIVFTVIVFILGGQVVSANEQVRSRTIEKILIYEHLAVIQITTPSNNLDNCTRQSAGHFMALDLKKPRSEILYATVLSAHLANRKVSFGVNGCANWGGTIPKIYRIEVLK